MRFSLSRLMSFVTGVCIGIGGVGCYASCILLTEHMKSAVAEVRSAAEMMHPFSPDDRVYIHHKSSSKYEVIVLRRDRNESTTEFVTRVNRHLIFEEQNDSTSDRSLKESAPMPLGRW